MLAPPTLWAGATIQYCWRSCSCCAEQQAMSTIAVMHSSTAVQQHSSTTNSTCCSCCCGAVNDAHSLSPCGRVLPLSTAGGVSHTHNCCGAGIDAHTLLITHPPRQASRQCSLVESCHWPRCTVAHAHSSTSAQRHSSYYSISAASRQASNTAVMQYSNAAALRASSMLAPPTLWAGGCC
jgi:hypothetical protein